jgi:hypothetical protein
MSALIGGSVCLVSFGINLLPISDQCELLAILKNIAVLCDSNVGQLRGSLEDFCA